MSQELCVHSLSVKSGGFNPAAAGLDEELGRFAYRKLECPYP
jgi:hypothetical protein